MQESSSDYLSLKTWAVDALADASAYTVGYACDELGLPEGVTFLASLVTGCVVSVNAGRYIFTDPVSGIVVEKMDADGMQALLKETDVDLGDMAWGGEKNGGTYSGEEWYNYFVDTYGKENLQGTFFNEIKYEPTSGVNFTPTEGKTTDIG